MSSTSSAGSQGRGLARIAVYYGVFFLVVFMILRYVPLLGHALAGGDFGGLGSGEGSDIFGPGSPPPVGAALSEGPWTQALVATVSIVGALAIMVPVTWVYMITRVHRGYDESVVHTLLVLPVAVTGIVMIVQSSLALAFSLAGIVAAVRFRTTLEDTKDAVYVFLAIGVGIASGVQASGIALAVSLVFNAVIIVLWRTRFGNVYADQVRRGRALGLGDVLAGPASASSALSVGDPSVLAAAAPADLATVADLAVRMERHVSEERAKKKSKRANTLLVLHAAAAAPAQTVAESVLQDLAERWKVGEITNGPRGFVLWYLARLDGSAVQGAVMDRLAAAPEGVIEAAELRSLQGMRPRT